jgi:hypothetical protein
VKARTLLASLAFLVALAAFLAHWIKVSPQLDRASFATPKGQSASMVILKMNFNFKTSNPTQAARKRQEEILLRQGIF